MNPRRVAIGLALIVVTALGLLAWVLLKPLPPPEHEHFSTTDTTRIVPGPAGHAYQFIAEPSITWTAARDAAARLTWRGHRGYLATITSAAEHAFPQFQNRIEIHYSDANTELVKFCSKWPRNQRAVVFLDPFGNQVAWETVEAIAATRAIDLWYLFPAGLGVHRQMGGEGPREGKEKSLDRLLGTPDWRTALISKTTTSDLFGAARDTTSIASPEAITEFMISRMKGIFKGGVLDEWLPLGSRGRHSYSLIFACANPEPKARDLAHRLARAVLRS